MNAVIPRIMIDFETAGKGARASILTFGACTFGLPFGASRDLFYDKISVASNEKAGRTFDKETMEFWNKQDPAMRAETFSGRRSLIDVLEDFINYAKRVADKSGVDIQEVELWSRGAGFDCEILQDVCYQEIFHYPFDFRKHMCQRTVERLMPQSLKKYIQPQANKHHALEDAIYQATVMDIALRNISWIGGMIPQSQGQEFQ